MSSWLAFASVDSNESDSLLNLVLNNRSDVVRSDQENHARFWFKEFGGLGVSLEESPVILFYPPRKIADHLWTIGRFVISSKVRKPSACSTLCGRLLLFVE